MTNALIPLAVKALPLLCLLGLAGCGAASDQSDARSYGGDNINVKARQVPGSGNAVTSGLAPGAPGHAPAAPAPAPSAPAASPAAPAAPATPDAPLMLVKAGVRNFQQINATMASLTGEPATTPAVAATYAALSASLPTGNDVQAFVGSNQVAVFKLAVEYCNALSADPAKASAAYGALNLTQPLATAFSSAGSTAFATALITKFWGANLATLPPQAESVAHLTALITALLQGKDTTLATLTPAIATAACAATLSAAPVTLF